MADYHDIDGVKEALAECEWNPMAPVAVFNRTYQDRKEWEAWREVQRKQRRLVSASKMPDAFGVGYNSFSSLMRYADPLQEPVPFNPSEFARKLLDHGCMMEPSAIEVALNVFEANPFIWGNITGGVPTRIYDLTDEVGCPDTIFERHHLMATYDTLHEAPYSRIPIPVEIKCPAAWMFRNYHNGKAPQSEKEACDEFIAKFPIGKPNYFIQSAYYSIVLRTKKFRVFVYFTTGDDSDGRGVGYEYDMTGSLRALLVRAIYRVITCRVLVSKDEKKLLEAEMRKSIRRVVKHKGELYYRD